MQYVHPYAAMSAKVFGTKTRPEAEVSLNVGEVNSFAGGRFCMNALSRNLDVSQIGKFHVSSTRFMLIRLILRLGKYIMLKQL